MIHAREACGAMVREWRAQGFKIPPKAQICGHHYVTSMKAVVVSVGWKNLLLDIITKL
jgi:hypothetical protein